VLFEPELEALLELASEKGAQRALKAQAERERHGDGRVTLCG